MSVTVARNVAVCPQCGGKRIVSDRQARTARSKEVLCAECRGEGLDRLYRVNMERNLRFWVERFGGSIPAETDARSYIAAGGAPPQLVELAKKIYK